MEVYKAINAVQKALCEVGIEKKKSEQQKGINYAFRGIDDVYKTVSPLLVKHNLCVIPRVVARTTSERKSSSGAALFYVAVEVEFDFVSALDGSTHLVRTFGEAMDSGDKATNKAMSAAYKYAAFMTFGIPTEGDNDTENTSHEVAPAIDPRITDAAMHLMGLPPDEQHTYWASIKGNQTFAGKVYMALDEDTKTHLKTIRETA